MSHPQYLIWEARTSLLETVFLSSQKKVFETEHKSTIQMMMSNTLGSLLNYSNLVRFIFIFFFFR